MVDHPLAIGSPIAQEDPGPAVKRALPGREERGASRPLALSRWRMGGRARGHLAAGPWGQGLGPVCLKGRRQSGVKVASLMGPGRTKGPHLVKGLIEMRFWAGGGTGWEITRTRRGKQDAPSRLRISEPQKTLTWIAPLAFYEAQRERNEQVKSRGLRSASSSPPTPI